MLWTDTLEIAEKLFISSNTVDTHRRNILKIKRFWNTEIKQLSYIINSFPPRDA